MIYDKRLALIEHIVFYSTQSVNASVNVRGGQLSATESRRESRDHRSLGAELVSHGDSEALRQPDHDSDDPGSGSAVSGGSSGRSSPADLDNDVLPLSYEPVRTVSVVRQRTKPATSQPGLCDSQSVTGTLRDCLCMCVREHGRYLALRCNVRENVKFFLSYKTHGVALISVTLAISQTPVYTVRPRIPGLVHHACVCLRARFC